MSVISGQSPVAVPGTAVQLGQLTIDSPLAVSALSTNTDSVFVGGANVNTGNGFELEPGDIIIFNHINSLTSIWVDALVAGEGISWLVLNDL